MSDEQFFSSSFEKQSVIPSQTSLDDMQILSSLQTNEFSGQKVSISKRLVSFEYSMILLSSDTDINRI